MSLYQTVLTLSESYYKTRVNKISEFIWNIIDTFREFLANNTSHFSRHQAILTFSENYWQTILHTFPEFISINHYWHFQRVPSILSYSKSFFSEFISHNTNTFRELLPNNIDLFRAHIKQYSHFHRVITKQ